MRYPRFRSFDMRLSFVVRPHPPFYFFSTLFCSNWGFVFSNHNFASRLFSEIKDVSPNLNLVKVANLNRVLRAKVFVSEDKQLKAIHLILDFKPLFDKFQDVGHVNQSR